ncbi:MAG: hypothetical protein H3C62_13475 [Gemmatimonadaceae bacterium]|nr:hypothetical protein [Gemmatimonadaceae bacterium]
MTRASAVPAPPTETPQAGTGVPCQVAQCDGVPCGEVRADCEHCDRATNTPCEEHRDATGDASSEPFPQPTLRHA